MHSLIPPAKLNVLRYLVNQAGAGFDSIVSARLSSAGVTHGVGEQLGRRVEFWVDASGVSFVPPTVVDWDAVDAEFAAAKKCTKGLSCGDSCISKTKTCKKPLTPAQAAQHKALIGRVSGTVVGPSSQEEELGLPEGVPRNTAPLPTPIPAAASPADGSTEPAFPETLADVIDADEEDPDDLLASLLATVSRQQRSRRRGGQRSRRQGGQRTRAAQGRSQEEEVNVAPRPSSGPSARRYPQPVSDGEIPPPQNAIDFKKSINVDGNKLYFYAKTEKMYIGDPSGYAWVARVGFKVNGSYSDVGLDPESGKKIAREVERLSREYVSSLPDGAILVTSAMTGDGKGGQRARAYQREGYSDPPNDRAGNEQRGFVKEGKLTPYSPDQLDRMKRGNLYGR